MLSLLIRRSPCSSLNSNANGVRNDAHNCSAPAAHVQVYAFCLHANLLFTQENTNIVAIAMLRCGCSCAGDYESGIWQHSRVGLRQACPEPSDVTLIWVWCLPQSKHVVVTALAADITLMSCCHCLCAGDHESSVWQRCRVGLINSHISLGSHQKAYATSRPRGLPCTVH